MRVREAALHKVTSRVFPENAAGLALARRLDFREVGRHLRHAPLDGVWRHVVTSRCCSGQRAPLGAKKREISRATRLSTSTMRISTSAAVHARSTPACGGTPGWVKE